VDSVFDALRAFYLRGHQPAHSPSSPGSRAMARLSTTRITRWRPWLREALDSGAPPYLARLPMTPEEVAAACDDAEAKEAARRN